MTVKLVKSVAGTRESHRATVRGLGLRKTNSDVDARGHAGGARNDQQGLVPGAGALSAFEDERSHATQHRSSRPKAPRRRVAASAAASARAWARPRAAATRARSRVRAATTRSASKAARCRCSAACPSAASSRTCCKYNAEITLGELQRLGAAEVDMLTLKQAKLIGEMTTRRQGHQDRRADASRSRSAAASSRPRAPRRRSKRPAARSPERGLKRSDERGNERESTGQERQVRRPAPAPVLPAGRARRLPAGCAHPGAGHRPEPAAGSCSRASRAAS